MTEELEQAEGTIETSPAEDTQTIDSIFSDALKEKAGTPEDVSHAEEEKPVNQVDQPEGQEEQAQKVAEQLFGELVISDAQKLPFKSKEDFEKFIESNPLLKDGFLRMADYTRKTTQVAEDRKSIEKLKQEFEQKEQSDAETWGGQKPDPESMKALSDVWAAFNHGSTTLKSKINEFVSDIQLIASGKPPVGPLSGQAGQFSASDAQIIELRREMEKIKRETSSRDQRLQEEKIQANVERATQALNAFEKELAQKGIKIERDEYIAMADFGHLIGKPKANGDVYTFEDAYKAALAVLGRSEKFAIKQVFAKSNELKKKTPIAPSSKIPANAQPAAKNDLDAIFNEGLRQLKD